MREQANARYNGWETRFHIESGKQVGKDGHRESDVNGRGNRSEGGIRTPKIKLKGRVKHLMQMCDVEISMIMNRTNRLDLASLSC